MGAGPGLYAGVWGLEVSWALWVLGLGSPWGRTFRGGGALRGGRAWVLRGDGPVGLCIGVRLGFSTWAGPGHLPWLREEAADNWLERPRLYLGTQRRRPGPQKFPAHRQC